MAPVTVTRSEVLEPANPTHQESAPIRVLFVEDDDDDRQIVSDELSWHGFAVRDFVDGEALLGSLDTASYADVIVLDWRLPSISGIDLLTRLRQHGVDLPVVFLTSHAQIPPAFGLAFSQAVWNVGFIVRPPHMFLLVTLNKDDMNPDHRYTDQFLSDREFNWQSQNRTTQTSKHGRMIHDHRTMGLHVHLLVRPTKRAGQTVTPFTYCGEVDFVSWEGNAPITVRLRLREPVPRTLWASLKVPDKIGSP